MHFGVVSDDTEKLVARLVRHTHEAGVLRLIEIVATPGRVENNRAAAAQRCQL
jgi:hypothetical protein